MNQKLLKAKKIFRKYAKDAGRFIRRQLDKLPTSTALIQYGEFRVRYHDNGLYTRKMTYDCCHNYANIFGGDVLWVRYDDPVKKNIPDDE